MSAAVDDPGAVRRTALQPGEVLCTAAGVEQIVYYRPGVAERPLAVFLPGGGHFARVAYGHPGADRRDFLDGWLAQEGYGLLALSYPSDHAAFAVRRPDLSREQWAESIARLIREHVSADSAREIVVLGWSMAGRAVVAIERALRRLALRQLCFVSLAATAPLPNLLPVRAAPERLTDEGFWDSSTRHRQWVQQLERQIGAAGRPVLDAQTYLAHYVVNSPSALRGQASDGTARAEALVAAGAGAFAYEDYPPVAAIIPEDSEDLLHALTDRAMWGALNVLRVTREIGDRAASVGEWAALRDLVNGVPQRLSRSIRGGHFFFIGAPGASATARHVTDLIAEAQALRRELHELWTD